MKACSAEFFDVGSVGLGMLKLMMANGGGHLVKMPADVIKAFESFSGAQFHRDDIMTLLRGETGSSWVVKQTKAVLAAWRKTEARDVSTADFVAKACAKAGAKFQKSVAWGSGIGGGGGG